MNTPSDAAAPVPSVPHRRHPWLAPVIAGLVVLVLAGVFLLGYLPRAGRQAALGAEAEHIASDRPRVRVQLPRVAPGTNTVRLPGTIEAARETGIYARSSGYVKSWSADLGAVVVEGQVLAEIDAPELQQQLVQARALLAQSQAGVAQTQANLSLAKLSLERVRNLGPAIASQQDIDTRQADYDVMAANVGMAEAKVRSDAAEVQRLTELVSFGRIVAPFAGTITQRAIEVGNLVNGGAGSQALFHLAQTDPVRVAVDAPQPVAPDLAVGVPATISQRGTPTVVTAAITHTARALDPAARTMRVEIAVPNADGRLLPGMYAEVAFAVPNRAPLLLIDSAALVQSARGTQVAVVDEHDRIRLATVAIAIDNGSELSISDGLSPTDRVVVNPAGRIRDGLAVEVAPPADAEAADGKPRP